MAFTRLDLEAKIREFFNLKELPTLINHQIGKIIREQECSYLDIARALYFWRFEKEQVLDERGIGIVPYILADSKRYFIEKAALEKEQLEAIEKKTKEERIIIVCKKPQKRKRKNDLIDISTISTGDPDGG